MKAQNSLTAVTWKKRARTLPSARPRVMPQKAKVTVLSRASRKV